MKTEKNILVAFLLNLAFSIFELFGGLFTGSVAILSDAVHDVGDATSIGISYFLEKKSKKQPDDTHTYGYARYSVVGGVITTLILLGGSVLVIVNAIDRLFHPTDIHYDGMLVFAIVGVIVNLCAALFTRRGDSLNQRAVNLHMLEDVLGWLVVLIGAIVMRFTDLAILDPLMSIGVAVFIFFGAIKNLMEMLDLFLEKTPHGVDVEEIKTHLSAIDGIEDVHHVHVWSMDGQSHYATLHLVVSDSHDAPTIKAAVRAELGEHGIGHVTMELEAVGEHCHATNCYVEHREHREHAGHHHHHHHHH